MISFCIKFLICFQKPVPPAKKEPKTKKAAEVPKSPASKGKQDKSQGFEAAINEPPDEKHENDVFCEENTREWCHVEYSLLADVLPPVEINIVTWGEVAKIYTKEDCRAVKTAVINDLVWVYFEVHHKTNVFSNEDLVKFKETKITFTFSQDTKKMMPKVANDWPKQFAFCDDGVKSVQDDKGSTRWFLELHQVDPPDEVYEPPSQKLDSFKISRPDQFFIVSMLNVKQCEKSIESKLQQITAALPIVDISKTGKAGKIARNMKEKKTDKKGKAGQTQADTNQLFVNSQFLIAGKYNACAERKEISQTIRYAAVYVNSSKILTDEQDITYVPLIVNIQALEALPIKTLQELNVKKVFARYEFADVLDEVETQRCFPQENIAIDETRVFFLSSPEEQSDHKTLMLRPSMLVLAEALLTRRFVVKIFGETELAEEEVVPCLFGDRPTDPFISTPDHEMFFNYRPPRYSTEIFIGSSSFNLIQLIKGYDVLEVCSILTSSPLSSWNPTCDLDEIMGSVQNEEEREFFLLKFSTAGAIPESIFLDHNSRVKLKVSKTCPLTAPEGQQLLESPQVSQRAIVIFKDQRYNNEVIKIIEKTNRVLLQNSSDSTMSLSPNVQFVREVTPSRVSLMTIRLSGCHNLNQTIQELRRRIFHPKTIITGFFLEHEEESILVFEAMTYVIPPLIDQIQSILESEDCARIICDSSIFFTKRLYTDFCPTNIFRIKIPLPLNALLKDPSYYTKQSLLDETSQALLLLDLLRRCRTLNNASTNQLFPSCKQLVSFCKAFGTKDSIQLPDYLSIETHKFQRYSEENLE